jgi:ABC-2 type transport system ATP-binding protein
MAEAALELDRVWKRYGDQWAVRDLSLALQPGEVFCFLGPNGAGKTTTIKTMCGLLRPTQGLVRVLGGDLASDDGRARRRLSYVPDMPFVYDKLTGREFLDLSRDLYGLPSAEAAADAARLIAAFEMERFVDQLAETYSHGMRQRLAFAGALLRRPAALIDPRGTRLVKDLLRAEAARGCAVFLSTHTLAIAEELADRVGIIRRGELIRCAPLAELRREFSAGVTLEDFFLGITHEDSP